MQLIKLLSFIWHHQLNRSGRFAAIFRFVRWQVASRLMNTSIELPFVNGSVLVSRRGMTGATGNFYCGLHEPDDMAFVLHVLKPGELFLDVGANVGSYTILAGSIGARTISIEPIPSTHAALCKNIVINKFDLTAVALCVGVSSTTGRLRFSADKDTMNHALRENEDCANSIYVPVMTIDEICRNEVPRMIKIDVEGHERAALAGAHGVLTSPELIAVIMEINEISERDGAVNTLVETMSRYGFSPFNYDIRSKSLGQARIGVGNTIFVRDPKQISLRTQVAAPVTLINGTI